MGPKILADYGLRGYNFNRLETQGEGGYDPRLRAIRNFKATENTTLYTNVQNWYRWPYRWPYRWSYIIYCTFFMNKFILQDH